MTLYYSAWAYENAEEEPLHDDEPEQDAEPDDCLTEDELDQAASEAESRRVA